MYEVLEFFYRTKLETYTASSLIDVYVNSHNIFVCPVLMMEFLAVILKMAVILNFQLTKFYVE